MRHAFISYCGEDEEFAKTLETQVELAGLRVWRDAGLRAGEDWRAEIDRGVRDALCVIVILSPDSAKSAYVNYEWAFALGCGIYVITVLYKPIDINVHPRLKEHSWIDLSTPVPASWRELFARLEEIQEALRPQSVLVRRRAPPSVQTAVQMLNSMDVKERDAALASLAQTTHPEVVEVLAEAVRHPVKRVRQLAARELAERHDARAIPALLEALRGCHSEDPVIRPYMLSEVGPRAVPALAEALQKEKNQEVRRMIYEALGNIGGSQAIALLRSHLESSATSDRYLAALALAKQSEGGAVPVLIEAAHGASQSMRIDSLYALSKYIGTHKDQILPVLLEALTGQDDNLVRAGISGLEASQDPAVIPYLLNSFFGAPYDFMNSGARYALQKFGSSPAPCLRVALADADPSVRLRATRLLRTFKDGAEVEFFTDRLADSDNAVRIAAIEALDQPNASTAVPALLDCLEDDDGAVVSAAVWSLGSIGDARAVPPLIDLLATGYGEILRRTIIALGKIGSPSAPAVPNLIELLNDKDLASAADLALEDIGTREAKMASRTWRARNRK